MVAFFNERVNRAGGTVPLFLVDYCFAEQVSQFVWSLTNSGYLQAKITGKNTYLHHFVWCLAGRGDFCVIDHINGDRLDNRIANLRNATLRLNMANVSGGQGGNSLPRGVRLYRGRGHSLAKPYQSHISAYGFQKSLGYFATPEEASQAYEEARQMVIEFESLKATM